MQKSVFINLLLCLLLGFSSAHVWAQANQNAVQRTVSAEKYTISGYIKDAANGEGLIGVSVYVKELATGAVTNNYGFFSIPAPAGTYSLVITYVGYEKQTRTVTLTDENKRLNIELGEEGKQLQEVVVSAQRDDDNVKNIEMSVNRIDVKTLQRIPALLGEVDVIRSIQLLPGVSTVGEGATGFNVRGGSIDQNLVLARRGSGLQLQPLVRLFLSL